MSGDTEVKTQKWTPQAIKAVEAIIQHHDIRQRKHDCPGYDCVVCSLHADESMLAEIISRETKDAEMADLLRALPLDDFGDDMGQHDAAEFVDHAGQFFDVMVKARALLTTLEKI